MAKLDKGDWKQIRNLFIIMMSIMVFSPISNGWDLETFISDLKFCFQAAIATCFVFWLMMKLD